jgi:phage protein D
MRLYSVVDVMKASKAKMEAKGTTLAEARRKTEARGEAVKRGRLDAMEKRRIALIDALAAVGLELEDCRSNSRFIEQTGRPKLTLEQIVQHAVHGHNFECQIQTEDDDLWY